MRTLSGARHVKRNPIKRIFAFAISAILAIASLISLNTTAQAAVQTFSYTGGAQLYVVPDGVTSINVVVSGAQGGQQTGGAVGGRGATVSATIAVNPGEVYMVVVGGNGTTNRGWNGGGRGAGNGGGASDIRRQSGAFNTSSSCAFTLTCAVADRIIVAGGGGGGGWINGGPNTAVGGDAGQTGLPGTAANLAGGDASEGLGATPSAGGAAGTSTFTGSGAAAGAGALANGGAAGWVANATGGGGGGGYYGGGAGAVSTNAVPAQDGTAGGGGGSSWAGGSGVSAATFTTGAKTGDGSITIDPPSAIDGAAFGFTGAEQFYTVPADTQQVYFRLYGAGGGIGAPGDVVYGRIPATTGEVLQLNIGGRGYGETSSFPGHSNGEGGWNGGGQGYYGVGWGGGGGGGGASDIRRCASPSAQNACPLAARFVVSGGGGGGSYPAWGLGGGHGGLGADGSGQNGYGGDYGLGASLTAGGGVMNTGLATAGTLGVGGTAGQPFYGAGGGGGGLYGGGGGNGSGGGGGSSCASVTTACNSTTNVIGVTGATVGHTGGFGSVSDGMAVITSMPLASTGLVTNVTSTTASVAGTLNAKYLASTPKLFIGTSQTLIDSCSNVNAPCTASTTVLRTASLATVLAGTTTQNVSGSITGLTANTTYYYRICGQSVAGYSCGVTSTFTTQLNIANSALNAGTVGTVYSDQIIASGGSGTYSSYALANGTTLPTGLSLNTATGAISGTPTAIASQNVDVRVTDSASGTTTKTLAITISAASQAQSQSAPSSLAPQIWNISPRTVSPAGGTLVTVTGNNLAGAVVSLGGQTIAITSSANNSFTFIVPAGISGTVPMTIQTTNGVLTFSNAIFASTPLPAASKLVKLTIDNFAPGSSVLSPTQLRLLSAQTRNLGTIVSISCVGYTMGPTRLATDKALAIARAEATCQALKRLAKTNAVSLTKAVTETRLGGAVRRVEITIAK